MAGVDINRTSFGQSLPIPVVNEIIGSARELSLVMRKAQRKTLVNGVANIGATAGVTGSKFVGETERKPLGTAEYSEKIMRAYKIALVLSFSDEFMRDKKALYQALRTDMPKDLAQTFDTAFLFGDGAPVGDFDTLQAAPTVSIGTNPYATFISTLQTSAAAGGNITEFVMSPQGEPALFTLAEDGRPLLAPSTAAGSVGTVLGRPVTVSKNVHKDDTLDTVGFAMDWDSVFWGMVEGIKYEEYRGPIFDDTGALVHAGAQDNMGSVICEVEVAARTLSDQRHVRITANDAG